MNLGAIKVESGRLLVIPRPLFFIVNLTFTSIHKSSKATTMEAVRRDAVIISNDASRLRQSILDVERHFRVAVVPPVSINDTRLHDYARKYRRKGDREYGSPLHTISLMFSHLDIWKKSYQYTSNRYLYIFEDDAMFEHNSTCVLDAMERTVPAPLLFYLGTCSPKNYGLSPTPECADDNASIPVHVCSSLCTHAYAILTNTSEHLATRVLDWAHHRALHGHSLYRYNIDVKLRGYTDASRPHFLCTNLVRQRRMNSTSGHSNKCCAW